MRLTAVVPLVSQPYVGARSYRNTKSQNARTESTLSQAGSILAMPNRRVLEGPKLATDRTRLVYVDPLRFSREVECDRVSKRCLFDGRALLVHGRCGNGGRQADYF